MTHYDTLGVKNTADAKEIKKAYFEKALANHPDKGSADEKEEREEKFKKIGAAYEILSNHEKRKKYDREINLQQARETENMSNESGEQSRYTSTDNDDMTSERAREMFDEMNKLFEEHRRYKSLGKELSNAFEEGNFAKAQSLHSQGAYLDEKSYMGRTPLHIMIEKKFEVTDAEQLNSINFIINYLLNSRLGINSCDANGQSPLHYAVMHGDFSLCNELLNKGATQNVQDNKHQASPLHWAIKLRKENIIDLLIAKSTTAGIVWWKTNSYDLKDRDGNTPLHLLLKQGLENPIIDLLVTKQASVSIENNAGLTAFAVSRTSNISELAKEYFKISKEREEREKEKGVCAIM